LFNSIVTSLRTKAALWNMKPKKQASL